MQFGFWTTFRLPEDWIECANCELGISCVRFRLLQVFVVFFFCVLFGSCFCLFMRYMVRLAWCGCGHNIGQMCFTEVLRQMHFLASIHINLLAANHQCVFSHTHKLTYQYTDTISVYFFLSACVDICSMTKPPSGQRVELPFSGRKMLKITTFSWALHAKAKQRQMQFRSNKITASAARRLGTGQGDNNACTDGRRQKFQLNF